MPDIAPDFEASLVDLQEALPDWWAALHPGSTLYKMLAAKAALFDALNWLYEQPYLNSALATANQEGLLRNFAYAWGLQNETTPESLESLRSFIGAMAGSDGSLRSLQEILEAFVDTPQNLTGGPLLTFPSGTTVNVPVNLVRNPNFAHELPATGSEPYAWEKGGWESLTVASTAGAAWSTRGAYMARAKIASLATGSSHKIALWSGYPHASSPVHEGQSYVCAMRVYLAKGKNTKLQLVVKWMESSGSVIEEKLFSGTEASAGGNGGTAPKEVLLIGELEAPTNAAFAAVGIRATNEGGSAEEVEVEFDEVTLHNPLLASTYLDGDILGYQWAEAAGKSTTSRPAVAGVEANMFPAPNFQFSTRGWVGTNTVVGVGAGPTFGTNPHDLGMESESASPITVKHNPAANVTVTPGKEYTASAYFYCVTGNTPVNVGVTINWLNAGESVLSTTAATVSLAVKGEWVRAVTTGVAPAGAKYAQLIFSAATTAAGQHYRLGGVQMVEGGLANPYVDASMTGYVWLGQPGESASAVEEQLLTFPADGEGFKLYQFEPGKVPTGSLRFPVNGEGLKFPGLPFSLPSDNMIGATGQTPPGAGEGLVFPTSGLVSITILDPGPYQFTVEVANWLTFNREAFRRAVERFEPADCLPAIIREVPEL